MFAPSWSAKLEYLYADISGGGISGGWSGNSDANFHPQINILRGGVNYHFNGFAPAPVLAEILINGIAANFPCLRRIEGTEAMRRISVFLHRYVGLAMAGFLAGRRADGEPLGLQRRDQHAARSKALGGAKPSPNPQPLNPATLRERAAEAMPEAVVGYFTPHLREDQVVLRMVWKSSDAPRCSASPTF